MIPNARAQLRAIFAVLLLVAAGLSSAVAAQPATPDDAGRQSQGGAMFVLRPENGNDLDPVNLQIDAGTTQEFTVVLGNQGGAALSLRTYVSDVHTNPNGGFGVTDESTDLTAPAMWLIYSPETYDLAPDQAIQRTVSVTVPVGTPAGQYIAAIVLQTVDPVPMAGTDLFNQIIRKSIPVIILVPGPITASATLGAPGFAVDATSARLVIPIDNTGNIRIQPEGALSLSDANGAEILTAPIAMRPVYAGDQTTIEIAVPALLPPGTYTLDLELHDAEQTGWSASIQEASVTLTPPPTPEPTKPPSPVAITSASISPVPDGGHPQYVDVAVEITNLGQQIPSSQILLIVQHDGAPLETFVLAQHLSLLEHTTAISQRYVPSGGWQQGTYAFSLRLLLVDPNTDVQSVVGTFDLPDRITVAP